MSRISNLLKKKKKTLGHVKMQMPKDLEQIISEPTSEGANVTTNIESNNRKEKLELFAQELFNEAVDSLGKRGGFYTDCEVSTTKDINDSYTITFDGNSGEINVESGQIVSVNPFEDLDDILEIGDKGMGRCNRIW